MKLHTKALLIVLVLAVAGVLAYRALFVKTEVVTSSAYNANGVALGQKIDIQAKTLAGKDFQLESLKGQKVIVNFWASWCGPCVEEVPSLIRLVKKYKGQVKLVAISGDSNRDDIAIFLKSFPDLAGENVELIWDEDKSLMKKFSVNGLPESLILNKDLTVAKKIVGSIQWDTADAFKYIDGL